MYTHEGKLQRNADYAWVIDRDYDAPEGDHGDDVGTEGPRNAPADLLDRLAGGREGHSFRMYDDDGELIYAGRILYTENGVVDGFEPLDDFGTPNWGCTEIRFHQGGEWVTL